MRRLIGIFISCGFLGFGQQQHRVTYIPSPNDAVTGGFAFHEKQANGNNRAWVLAPDSIAADYALKWPASDAPGCLKSDGAGNLAFLACGASGHQIPDLDNTYDIGTAGPPAKRWRNLYLHGSLVLSAPAEITAIHAAPAGVVNGPHVLVRHLGIADAQGGTVGWDLIGNSNSVNVDLAIRDQAGSPAVKYTRRFMGSENVYTSHYGDQLPGSNNTFDFGRSSARWRSGHFEDMVVYNNIGSSAARFSTAYGSGLDLTGTSETGAIWPRTDNGYTLGSGARRWAAGHFVGALYAGELRINGNMTIDGSRNAAFAHVATLSLGTADRLIMDTGRNFGNVNSLTLTGTSGTVLNAAPAGVVDGPNVLVRHLGIADRQGGLSNWDFYANSNLTTSDLQIRDPTGTPVIRFRRLFAGAPDDSADVYVNLVPDSDNGQSLGATSKRWSYGHFDNLNVSNNIGSSGTRFVRAYGWGIDTNGTSEMAEIWPRADNAHTLGSGARRWAAGHFLALYGNTLAINGTQVLDSNRNASNLGSVSAASYQVSGAPAINSSRQFVGAGVDVQNNGIGAGGFNHCQWSGSSCSWSYGQTITVSVRNAADTGSCTITFKGGVITASTCS
ncbi:MAG: hypothetical protein KIT09_02135 [Bryobacteraceae bacterium]|nr:hypothetical protein [Bryobacteraceae bacterium]